MRCSLLGLASATALSPLLAQSTDAGWTRLTGTGLGVFRDPAAWIDVGAATVDPKDARKLATASGRGVFVNGSGRTRNLLTATEWGDIEAHIEFMVPKGSNSGVYFMGRYEIQILDSHGKDQVTFGDCGGIYERWPRGSGFGGRAPRVNASRAPGEWQSFDVVFRAPRFDASGKKIGNAKFVRVIHNGKVVHEDVELDGPTRAAQYRDERPTGPLMFQGDHGPVAYRNVRVRPLPGGAKPTFKKFDWRPTAEHERITIEGFSLLVDPRLVAREKLWAQTRRELASQLYQITRKVPGPALDKLRKVRIFVQDRSKTRCMAYHPSRRWLQRNGYNPDFAKCVELGNPKAFLSWTKAQPWMVLHELAHAYHDQFLAGGYGNRQVLRRFAAARRDKLYEKVQHINGNDVRAYALTNHKEYFAETSEAYFGTNDMFPFVRSELATHDKAMWAALRELWGG